MNSRKINNKGAYIENSNVNGGESYIAGRDINRRGDTSGISPKDFQSILSQVLSELGKANISKNDQDVIKTNIDLAIKQSQKSSPKKSLIVGPLTTAMELIIQASGAAGAAYNIVQLLQKAITYAQGLFH